MQAGELTAKERQALLESGLPPSQYAFILLQWVGLYAMGGLKAGTLRGSNGFEENLLRQLTGLRAEYFNVGDYAAGRMPLAYVQLVQVLIDSLVLLAPFSLYPELGSLAIPATGLLTLFFKGLLELSKSFLDPFGNEATRARTSASTSSCPNSTLAPRAAGPRRAPRSRTRRARRRRRRHVLGTPVTEAASGDPYVVNYQSNIPHIAENFLCLSGSPDPTIALLEAPRQLFSPFCCAGATPMAASSRSSNSTHSSALWRPRID